MVFAWSAPPALATSTPNVCGGPAIGGWSTQYVYFLEFGYVALGDLRVCVHHMRLEGRFASFRLTLESWSIHFAIEHATSQNSASSALWQLYRWLRRCSLAFIAMWEYYYTMFESRTFAWRMSGYNRPQAKCFPVQERQGARVRERERGKRQIGNIVHKVKLLHGPFPSNPLWICDMCNSSRSLATSNCNAVAIESCAAYSVGGVCAAFGEFVEINVG